jgi:N-glycosylase/DNA lyase
MTERINAPDFALAATLQSGQAFRWNEQADGVFAGVVGRQVWRLKQDGADVLWEAWPGDNQRDQAGIIRHYLALDVNMADVVASFPREDRGLAEAVRQHWGLRILRQDPWECLASFIASSTKQIVQIRQIVESLARRHGQRLTTPWGEWHAFPSAEIVAGLTEADLRACKLGFRAKYLLTASRMVSTGEVRLRELVGMQRDAAESELMKIPGVGGKIANCALLFSCGHDAAFPVDVWIERALRRMYFSRNKKANARQLRAFALKHFGPYAGWAQQYMFCDERRRARSIRRSSVT